MLGETALDLEAIRADTPGCEFVAHLNNAGSSLPPTVVTETVVGHLYREAQIGGYEAAEEADDRVEATYASIARLVGGSPADVALLDNATRAWQAVFYGLPCGPGDRILTSRADYASSLIDMLQVAVRTGASIEVVEDDQDGQVDVADLRRRLDGPVALVAMAAVPTHGGLVNPIEQIGAATREAGAPFLLDACQAAGQLDLDVERIGCDALVATGRKYLRGPRGTGFLWVRPDLRARLDPPWPDLRGATWTAPRTYELRADARVFETWERNVAGLLGLGAAVDYVLALGLPAVEQRVALLGRRLRGMLAERPGVRVHDTGRRRCGIVTFTVEGVPAHEVRGVLRDQRVNTSVSLVEYSQLDLPRRGLSDLVRASPHYYNTEDELRWLCEALPAPRLVGRPPS